MTKVNNNYRNNEQDRRLERMEEKVEFHIETINKECGDIRIDIREIKTNVNWLMRNYWLIAGSSIGALMGAIFNLFFK